MASIREVVSESSAVRSFVLDFPIVAKPGQFVMVWIPRLDEKPFSLTRVGNQSAITVMQRGLFTTELAKLKPGDQIGIRGPFGNGFDFSNVKKACIVAGGCGAASVVLLSEALAAQQAAVTIVLGAKTASSCLFEPRFEKTGRLLVATDDGSKGHAGFGPVVLEKLLESESFDCVFACGPELMLVKVFELCQKNSVRCQISLERFMRCGFGLCGQCAVNGFLVCSDGPVFENAQLAQMSDFGKSALLKSTRKVTLSEFSDWRQSK